MEYYSHKDTPLRFHKFFRFVFLPLSFIITVTSVVPAIPEFFNYGPLYAVTVVYWTIRMALMIIIFTGFFRWRLYAWYCIFIYLAGDVMLNLGNVIINIIDMGGFMDGDIRFIWEMLGFLAYAIFVVAYYKKRRALFSSAKSGDEKTRHCRECNKKLDDDSAYCSRCGTHVE